MRLIFFGASKHVIPTIKMLNERHDLVLVVTTEDQDTDAVPAYCKALNIEFMTIKKFDPSVIERIRGENAELGVLAYFGQFLPNEVLDIFPKGILNIHPSLLPLYRGPTPVQSAILDGKKETGVTIIKLDEEMDHGPILGQEKEIIHAGDTTETLHKRLFAKGAEMLEKIIPSYINGDLKPVEQNHTKATYSKKDFTREDGYFDLSELEKLNSELEIGNWKLEIDRMIRAYHPWPGVWTKWKMENGKWKILKLLPGGKFQVEGKKPVSLRDFINGYPEMKEMLKKIMD